MISTNESVLDNPIWHSLTTHHAHFAAGTERAKIYPMEVTRFAGLSEFNAAALHDLAQIVAPEQGFALVGDALPADLPGWKILYTFHVIQMVSQQPISAPESAETVLDLTAADVPDMLQLVELTKPGPFFPRTIEMGHYIGIRKEGQLVAMAGERMHPSGYCEISAVCTHPDYQGRGYARLLVSRAAAWNWQRGDVPFLHVAPNNARAQQLYESLGFRTRRDVEITVVSLPASGE